MKATLGEGLTGKYFVELEMLAGDETHLVFLVGVVRRAEDDTTAL